MEKKPSSEDLEIIKSQLIRGCSDGLLLAERGAALVKEAFPGWEVNAQALSGQPAFEMIEQADKYKMDLIVVGATGTGAISRALLGSVSQRVTAPL